MNEFEINGMVFRCEGDGELSHQATKFRRTRYRVRQGEAQLWRYGTWARVEDGELAATVSIAADVVQRNERNDFAEENPELIMSMLPLLLRIALRGRR